MTCGRPFYIGLIFLLVPYDIILIYVSLAYVKPVKTIVGNNIHAFVTMKNIIVFIVFVLADCKIAYIVRDCASGMIHGLKNAPVGIIQYLCAVQCFGECVGWYIYYMCIQINIICSIAF